MPTSSSMRALPLTLLALPALVFCSGQPAVAHATGDPHPFAYTVPPQPGSPAMQVRPIPHPPGPPPWAHNPKPAGTGSDTAAPGAAPASTGYQTTGDMSSAVLAIDFRDKTARTDLSHYDDMLFDPAGYPDDIAKSMRAYYREASYGDLNVNGKVYGKAISSPTSWVSWIRAPQTYRYYVAGDYGFGTYPRNAQKLAEDAVKAADAYVNFADLSTYSGTEWGVTGTFVSSLFVVHAGPGAEATGNVNDIWSHAWVTTAPIATNDKIGGATVYVYRYVMLAEDSPMGVFGHEFGHTLGLPDLYDYDGTSAGVGAWDMMGYGSWNDGGHTPALPGAWCKIRADWLSPTTVEDTTPPLAVAEVATTRTSYKLPANGTSPDEYFLVENRQQVGFDANLPSNGLLIWHIDDTVASNDNESHPLVALEQADGRGDLVVWRNSGDSGDPFPGDTGNHRFDGDTTPSSRTYSGAASGVAVTGIDDSGATLMAVLSAGGDVPPSVTITSPDEGTAVTADVTIMARATDDVGVTQVDFHVDGQSIGIDLEPDGEGNWSMAWDSAVVPDGPHALSAIATDTLGQTTAAGITVRTENFNDPPIADAGPDQVVADADDDGWETVTLTAAGGGITFDAASTASTPETNLSALSWSHTTTGVDRIMLVGVTTRSNRSVTSLTYDGVGLTKIRHDTGGIDVRSELWYLIAPHEGTHTVALTTDVATTIEAGATTWTGVGQTVATALGNDAGAYGTGDATGLQLASGGGEVVVDVVGTQNVAATVTAASGQTERWNVVGYWANGAASSEPGAPSVALSWTLAVYESWATSAVALKPSGSYDPDGTITSFAWDINGDDVTDLTGATVTADFGLGDRVVKLTVTDDDGEIASDTVLVSVIAAPPPNTMHIGDLDASKSIRGGKWQVTVTVTVHDRAHGPVAGAVVAGTWSGAHTGTVSGTTGADGTVTFTTPRLSSGTEVAFTVTGATHSILTYAALDNHDPETDSDGTVITVRK